MSLVQAQQQTAQANSARLALEETNALSARLDKYTGMEYLINPHIPAELKANYQFMALNLQAKLHAADNAVAPPTGSRFHTPPTPTSQQFPSPAAAARRSLGRELSSGASTTSDDVEEHGLFPRCRLSFRRARVAVQYMCASRAQIDFRSTARAHDLS